VVHLKGSLWEKMPGDDWQKAANLRLLYAHMVGHPGKMLLFMGSEFGQTTEWNHDIELPWAQASEPLHNGISTWLHDLLHLYRANPALHDDSGESFEWIDFGDRQQSVISYVRRGRGENGEERALVFVLNLTPVPRPGYAIGVPKAGTWSVVLGSDSERYGGSGVTAHGQFETSGYPHHGREDALTLDLPPLGVLILEHSADAPEETADEDADAVG
jgi:1,4-alpha-glucan branching enzyme